MNTFSIRVELDHDAFLREDEHFIIACLVDKDGTQIGQTVHFADLRSMRSYYNGMCQGLRAAGMTRVELPYRYASTREYEVPVNPRYSFACPIPA